MKRAVSAVLACLVAANLSAGVLTVSSSHRIPPSAYADENNPPCSNDKEIAAVLRDREFQEAVAKINVEAGAWVVAASKANDTALNAGGDFAKHFRRATGQPSKSSCAVFCVRGPAEAKATTIQLSRRHGVISATDGTVVSQSTEVIDSLDHSGWRDVVVFTDSKQRATVCAAATNWSHDQIATKTIEVKFDEDRGVCGGYTRVEGNTQPPNNAGERWTGTWNFQDNVLKSRHDRVGVEVTGRLSGATCDASRVAFTALHDGGGSCTCNLTRVPSGGERVEGNCACPGAGVLMTGRLVK